MGTSARNRRKYAGQQRPYLSDPWNHCANYGPKATIYKFIYNLSMTYQPPYYKTQHGIVGHILGRMDVLAAIHCPEWLALLQSATPREPVQRRVRCQAFGESTPPASVSSVAENAVHASPYTGGNSANYNDARS